MCQQVIGMLLIWNEELFANQYNFPSKVLEALSAGMLIVSTYPISGVPSGCYVLAQEGVLLEESVKQSIPILD